MKAKKIFASNVKTVYLASPFFDAPERNVYQKVIKYLRAAGYDVYVPQEHEIEHAWNYPNDVWGNLVFQEDVFQIRDCDAVAVINWGMYSDSGTAWEQGFTYALGKPIVSIIVNTAKEKCGNNSFSLMMANGCTTSIMLSDLLKEPADFLEINQK